MIFYLLISGLFVLVNGAVEIVGYFGKAEGCYVFNLMEVHLLFEENGQVFSSANIAQNITRSWLQQGNNGQK